MYFAYIMRERSLHIFFLFFFYCAAVGIERRYFNTASICTMYMCTTNEGDVKHNLWQRHKEG